VHKAVKALAVVGIAFIALIGISVAVYYAEGGDKYSMDQRKKVNR
jgi:hypothetical protein